MLALCIFLGACKKLCKPPLNKVRYLVLMHNHKPINVRFPIAASFDAEWALYL